MDLKSALQHTRPVQGNQEPMIQTSSCFSDFQTSGLIFKDPEQKKKEKSNQLLWLFFHKFNFSITFINCVILNRDTYLNKNLVIQSIFEKVQRKLLIFEATWIDRCFNNKNTQDEKEIWIVGFHPQMYTSINYTSPSVFQFYSVPKTCQF